MSDTPRTDDVARMPTDAYPNQMVDVKFARELERENAAMREGIETALRRLQHIDPAWAVGAATPILEKALKS